MTSVVVVGSANMDLVVATPVLPRPGETVLGSEFATLPGGKGANQAIAAAQAGADCAFIGAVGDDAFGAGLLDNLAAHGVNTLRARRTAGPSGVALIAVDSGGENLIVVAPGANATLSRLDSADLELIEAADVVVCQLEIPLSAVAQAAHAARRFILNAAPAQPLPHDLLAAVDLLVVNQSEAATMVGRSAPPEELLRELIRLVPRAAITLGPAGVAFVERTLGEILWVGVPDVVAVDTTGAGDAFTGALAAAWAMGRSLPEAMRWACAAGAACVTKRGATMPSMNEIDELYRINYAD